MPVVIPSVQKSEVAPLLDAFAAAVMAAEAMWMAGCRSRRSYRFAALPAARARLEGSKNEQFPPPRHQPGEPGA